MITESRKSMIFNICNALIIQIRDEYLTLKAQNYFIALNYKIINHMSNKPRKKLIHKLKSKFKLVIINDSTFEEKFSLSLTPMNVFVAFSSFLVFFASIIITLIVFTPIREYIPGYTDTRTIQLAKWANLRVDSLEKALMDKEMYYKNLLNIVHDRVEYADTAMMQEGGKKTSENLPGGAGKLEQQLQKEFEHTENNDVMEQLSEISQAINAVHYFAPVKGVVTEIYNATEGHYAVDVVTKQNEPVKAISEGRVVLSTWTPETGNIIAIQHRNSLLSIYKHNAVLLKKVGMFVTAGEPVAVVGNTGELTTGPHLHFEIWENGKPTNPEDYINFN
jgi:murein DD-endopeptidase MepM/ murein hydrolase activator NlpD